MTGLGGGCDVAPQCDQLHEQKEVSMADRYETTRCASVAALTVGAVIALAPVHADAATIRIVDLTSGGDPDYTMSDTGAIGKRTKGRHGRPFRI
ncbi:hypothetical protein ACROSR_05710 [Roseovarius tibetensis]|uniref:hypothetical protein n=1 Tax=Roseovarius tibetensis TaxID=2685897 RepID=UPI003D7FA2CD